MKRFFARFFGFHYMAPMEAMLLLEDHFNAIWEASQYHAQEKMPPDAILQKMAKNYCLIYDALTRGVYRP